jgi:tetratricopeptide (TPR) repeat protein
MSEEDTNEGTHDETNAGGRERLTELPPSSDAESNAPTETGAAAVMAPPSETSASDKQTSSQQQTGHAGIREFLRTMWSGFIHQTPLDKTLTVSGLLGGIAVLISLVVWIIGTIIEPAWAEDKQNIAVVLKQLEPTLNDEQIVAFLNALEEARNSPSFEDAVKAAKNGKTKIAKGIWEQIYEDEKAAGEAARLKQAQAVRNIAATAVIENAAEGLRWYREAVELDPENMAGWVGLGDAAMLAGQVEDAVLAFNSVIRLAEDTEDVRDDMLGQLRLGASLIQQGELGDAREAIEKGVTIGEQLAADDPSSTLRQRDLSVSYTKLGRVLFRQGDFELAGEAFVKSLGIREKLAAAEPSNVRWQSDLSVSYETLGDVRLRRYEFELAREAYEKSLGIRKKLAAADPSNTEWQSKLSVSYDKLAEVMVRNLGDVRATRELFEKSLSIREKLAAADPSNTRWQRDLAFSYTTLGSVLFKQGEVAAAREALEKSLSIYKKLAAADPSNVQLQVRLAGAYYNIALTDAERSTELLETGLGILNELHVSGRLPPFQERWIARFEAKLAAD